MPCPMRDVAQSAGVSVTTVSHVLNKTRHRPVALKTRPRVLDAVRDLNYHADANARRLAQNRSNLFGLIVSEIANPFFPEVIGSFEDAAVGRGFELLLCHTEYNPVRCRIAVRKMLENTFVAGPQGIHSAVRSLWEQSVSPTAIVCGNDLAAVGVISALEEVGSAFPRTFQWWAATTSCWRAWPILRSPARPGAVYQLETGLVIRKSSASRKSRDLPVQKSQHLPWAT
jgi:DNA-binding LacI/PurR family transcriptional regulator